MNNIGGIGVTLKADFDESGLITGYAKVKQSAQGVATQLKQTDAQVKQSQGVFSKYASSLGQKMGQVTKSFKVQKGAAAQMGMQLQDVAVMAQYGADKMVILGQQGSQIASLFGPGGAMLGALIAVGSAVAGVAMKMSETAKETENLDEKLRSLAETSALTAEEQAYINSLDEKSIEGKRKRVKAIEDEIKAEQDRLQAMKTEGTGLDTGEFAVPRTAQANQERYSESIAKTTANVLKLRAELSFLNKEITGDRKSTDEGDLYSAEKLEKIKAGLEAERKLFTQLQTVKSNVESEFITEREGRLEEQLIKDRERLNRKLEQTRINLEQERQLILENEVLTAEEKAALLADIKQAELNAEQMHFDKAMAQGKEFQKALTKMEKDAAQKREQVAERERKQKVGIASGMMGNLSSLMNTESKKLFEIGKAASIAGAIVDGLEAVQGAYKVGSKLGGPPLGAAYAATAAVATAAQVQQIAQTKFGSAATGQSFSGGQVVNNTGQAPQQPDRNISIALTGSSFSGGDIRSLIGAINEELGDGANLNITGG